MQQAVGAPQFEESKRRLLALAEKLRSVSTVSPEELERVRALADSANTVIDVLKFEHSTAKDEQ